MGAGPAVGSRVPAAAAPVVGRRGRPGGGRPDRRAGQDPAAASAARRATASARRWRWMASASASEISPGAWRFSDSSAARTKMTAMRPRPPACSRRP